MSYYWRIVSSQNLSSSIWIRTCTIAWSSLAPNSQVALFKFTAKQVQTSTISGLTEADVEARAAAQQSVECLPTNSSLGIRLRPRQVGPHAGHLPFLAPTAHLHNSLGQRPRNLDGFKWSTEGAIHRCIADSIAIPSSLWELLCPLCSLWLGRSPDARRSSTLPAELLEATKTAIRCTLTPFASRLFAVFMIFLL
jgi:hypothetical protein